MNMYVVRTTSLPMALALKKDHLEKKISDTVGQEHVRFVLGKLLSFQQNLFNSTPAAADERQMCGVGSQSSNAKGMEKRATTN